jgi:hypothetical protein
MVDDDEWFSTPHRNKPVSAPNVGNVVPAAGLLARLQNPATNSNTMNPHVTHSSNLKQPASDLRSSHSVQRPAQPKQLEPRPTNPPSSRVPTESSTHSNKSSNRSTPSIVSSVEATPRDQPNNAGKSSLTEPTITKRQAKKRAKELKKQHREQQAALDVSASASATNPTPQTTETSGTDAVEEKTKAGQPPTVVEPAALVPAPPQDPIIAQGEAEPDNSALRISTGFKNEYVSPHVHSTLFATHR